MFPFLPLLSFDWKNLCKLTRSVISLNSSLVLLGISYHFSCVPSFHPVHLLEFPICSDETSGVILSWTHPFHSYPPHWHRHFCNSYNHSSFIEHHHHGLFFTWWTMFSARKIEQRVLKDAIYSDNYTRMRCYQTLIREIVLTKCPGTISSALFSGRHIFFQVTCKEV